MRPLCKITVFLVYLSTLQFTAAFAVMAGEKLGLPKNTKVISTPMQAILPSDTRTVRKIVTAQVYTHDKDLCGVSDSSSNHKRSFNCSSSTSSKAKHCGSNSRLIGESCLCNEGYKKFPFSEVCVKTQGQPCVFQQNDCATDMTSMACVNNVCSCEDSDIYDHITLRCVGRVGGLCYPGIKDCVLNAECANIPSTVKRDIRKKRNPTSSPSEFYYDDQIAMEDYIMSSNTDIELSGRCQCKDGFSETLDGLCRKSFGESCKSGDECDSLNLVCKEGYCTCPDTLQVYNVVRKSCEALVGAKCSDEPGGIRCMNFAFCHKMNTKMDGKCACVEDAMETELRTCERDETLTSNTLPLSSIMMTDENEHKSNRVIFNNF